MQFQVDQIVAASDSCLGAYQPLSKFGGRARWEVGDGDALPPKSVSAAKTIVGQPAPKATMIFLPHAQFAQPAVSQPAPTAKINTTAK